MKKIAILTSGGDAPGMNACLRSIVRSAIYYGMEVYGVKRGYYGLVYDDLIPMGMRSVSDIVQRGGTILHTARCMEFKEKEGQLKAVETLKNREIEGLVVIGGDGSFRGAKDLSELGIPTIGIPGTIDNDLAYTDYTLGFDTAVNTCLDIINKLRDTMNSHERVSIVEVMGRSCGDIALYSGLAGGAEIIIVPEKKIAMAEIVAKINKSREKGKSSNIVILAEGAGDADKLGEELQKLTHYSVRSTKVGHIQRGGSPSMVDRLLASQFGYRAVELLRDGIGNRVIGISNNQIVDYDIIEALNMKSKFNEKLYEIANKISM
jgi:6-phosphofructokinase 1